jgi:hypothetical protein
MAFERMDDLGKHDQMLSRIFDKTLWKSFIPKRSMEIGSSLFRSCDMTWSFAGRSGVKEVCLRYQA